MHGFSDAGPRNWSVGRADEGDDDRLNGECGAFSLNAVWPLADEPRAF